MFADLGSWFARVIGGGLAQTALLLFCIALPFALLTLLLHWLERRVQYPLARRFGWSSVIWTGWLGTPIHELSHVALCWVFRHRIDEVALFRPDKKAGRLGYVKHAYNRKSIYQTIGNFFIGLAPLAGGTLVLFLSLWLFYPGAATQAFDSRAMSDAIAGGHFLDAIEAFAKLGLAVLSHVASIGNLATLRFWIFIYLTLCIGSHMAPSRDDYRGATWGGVLVLVIILVVQTAFLAAGGKPGELAGRVAPFFGPALALFSLCAVLCGFVAILVFIFSSLLDWIFSPSKK